MNEKPFTYPQFDDEFRRLTSQNIITRIIIRIGPDFLLRAATHNFRRLASENPDEQTVLKYQSKLQERGLQFDQDMVIQFYQVIAAYTADELTEELGRRAARRASRRKL